MKKLLISLSLIACGFTGSPAKAQIDLEQRTNDTNIGRMLGWLEATCFYVETNVLNESVAKGVIAHTLKREIPAVKSELYEGENTKLFLAFAKKKNETKECRKLFPPSFFN